MDWSKTRRFLPAVMVAGALTACAQPSSPNLSAHWDDKATLNERKASEAVSGFEDSQRSAYHLGLQHLLNAHQKVGSFTIREVVDQELAREAARDRERQRIADAKAQAEERARKAREAAAYAEAHRDFCDEALNQEKVAASHGVSHSAAYHAAVRGLELNERCDNETAQLVNKGYLLTMKAFAEHYLSEGDARTDFNQANQLLEECVTKPGLYGTQTGASCETQIHYNIEAQSNWDMQSSEAN